MGYYATSIEGRISIPKDKQDDALKNIVATLTALNEGREEWFKVQTYENETTLKDVMEQEGFWVETEDNGDFTLMSFDAKWREQEHVLNALADYVTEDSELGFAGEDYTFWKWTPEGIVEGRVVWE